MTLRRAWLLTITLLLIQTFGAQNGVTLSAGTVDATAWRLYTNARFGFSVRYPDNWRLGNPMPDGMGVTLYPPIDNSLVALSGHMNVLEGTSQDGRQTLAEFSAAHRRIITELFAKKAITIKWRQDQDLSLGGFPAKRLAFTYSDAAHGEMVEAHIFSLGRNEGRGIRIKVPLTAQERLMPTIAGMLESYQAGRDQNAVSPLAPQRDPETTPHS